MLYQNVNKVNFSERTSDTLEQRLNKEQGNLNEYDGYACKECNNRGYSYVVVEHNDIRTRECKCMNTRRIVRKLNKSGLRNVIDKYKFSNYKTNEHWQKHIFDKAVQVSKNDAWFFIGGQSGCGKTHICTAICSEHLKMGKDVVYMLWINDVKQLKNTINDYEAHNDLIEKYKKATVLYVDDFFKTGRESDGNAQPPSTSDVKIAYEIINYRYINNLVTIISSERIINEINAIDEAIAGRIFERANFGEFVVNVGKDKVKNYRMKTVVNL